VSGLGAGLRGTQQPNAFLRPARAPGPVLRVRDELPCPADAR
jgi:hypothetical protein